jgi:hypothetical protein
MDSLAWALVSQTAGLARGNAITDARGGVLLPSMLGFQLPPPSGLEHDNFQVDSGLIERAMRSSCFGAGNETATSADDHTKATTGGGTGDDDNAEPEVGGFHDEGRRAEATAGDCSSGGLESDSKKRKRSNKVCALLSIFAPVCRLQSFQPPPPNCRNVGRSWGASSEGTRGVHGFSKRERAQQRCRRQRERGGGHQEEREGREGGHRRATKGRVHPCQGPEGAGNQQPQPRREGTYKLHFNSASTSDSSDFSILVIFRF